MPRKKATNKANASPKKQAAPKQRGTAATRAAKQWLEECENDSDDTSSSAGQCRGSVPQQAGGAASGVGAAVGQQRGSAVSGGCSSSLGADIGAAENAVVPASFPAIAPVVAAVVRQPTAEPSARALRERERRAVLAASGVEGESSQRMRVNRANPEYAEAEHQRRSQEIQMERAQQHERDLRARPQHMAELARRRAVVGDQRSGRATPTERSGHPFHGERAGQSAARWERRQYGLVLDGTGWTPPQ